LTLDPTGASTSLWVVDKSTDRVYEYANGRARRSGSQGASVSFPLNSANGSAEGIADPYVVLRASSLSSAASSSTAYTPVVSFVGMTSTSSLPITRAHARSLAATQQETVHVSVSRLAPARGHLTQPIQRIARNELLVPAAPTPLQKLLRLHDLCFNEFAGSWENALRDHVAGPAAVADQLFAQWGGSHD
jgi:hypothetical protein